MEEPASGAAVVTFDQALSFGLATLDFGLDVVPVVSTIKAVAEGINGETFLTGDEVTPLAAALGALPAAKVVGVAGDGISLATRQLRRSRFIDNLSRLKPPTLRHIPRDRFDVVTAPDPQLAERAREVRAGQGLRPDDFRTNVAVAKIEVNGVPQIIDNANLPRGGPHSEELIVGYLDRLRRQGHEVELREIYSERHPCVGCLPLLRRTFPAAKVFYSVPQGRQSASLLQKEYGLR